MGLPRSMKTPVRGAPPNDKSNTGFVNSYDSAATDASRVASHRTVIVDCSYRLAVNWCGTRLAEHDSCCEDNGALTTGQTLVTSSINLMLIKTFNNRRNIVFVVPLMSENRSQR